MVEVFKTNVTHNLEASWLIDQIHNNFASYTANFDLEDCDKILRVQAMDEPVQPQKIVSLLEEYGFEAQVLPDDYPLVEGIIIFHNDIFKVYPFSHT
ncbi:hypothetical protein Q0590_22115 [Rhodocytophaga aerolata]|uniref:Uncharacterized protein n=1 Tax=Rhodocytophaga aerolata TaxID=455078 RepID=A0ABT8RE44_9BACT|nr:hypothetical protein [Rhodocytophaga aerolata]MDO1448990.1 hypothetical protein [Rhodocytophaga aerolata]